METMLKKIVEYDYERVSFLKTLYIIHTYNTFHGNNHVYTNTYKLCCKNVGAGLTSFSRASWRRWCGSTSSGWTSTSRCCGWKMWKIGIRGNLTNDVTDDRSLNFLFSETPPSVWDSSTQLAKKGSWPLLMIKDACTLNHGRLKRSFRPKSKGRMRNVWFELASQWNPADYEGITQIQLPPHK